MACRRSFLLLGKLLYSNKVTRFPREQGNISRFLQTCGRYSLPIYLAHQPALLAALALTQF